jgi:hypothetical protein
LALVSLGDLLQALESPGQDFAEEVVELRQPLGSN